MTVGAMVLLATGARAEQLKLSDLVREIKVALTEVQDTADASNIPPLSAVELTLKTIQDIDATGKVSLYVVTFGGGGSTGSSSSIFIRLAPPAPGTRTDVSTADLAEQLVPLILSGSEAIAEAMIGNPPLVATELTATLNFTIEYKASGGFKILFAPFSATAGTEVKSSQIHTVKVTYKP